MQLTFVFKFVAAWHLPRRFVLARVIAVALAVCALWEPRSARAGAPSAAQSAELGGTKRSEDVITSARRVVHLVDYVGSDYAKAIGAPGAAPDEKELGEQIEVVEEAERSAGGLREMRDEVMRALQDLAALVKQRRPASEVAASAEKIRRLLETKFALARPPARPPSFERGASLFADRCAGCHGAEGRGDGPRARVLAPPPPADFHSPALVADLSPDRVFATSRFGVPGTAMAAVEPLSDEERWDIAFYVVGLSHVRPSAPVEGARLFTLEDLTMRTDGELRADLAAAGFAGSRLSAALDDLRTRAPYEGGAPAAGLSHAIVALRRVPDLYAAGRVDEARAALVATYLDDIEPVEPELRGHAGGAAERVEAGFRELRVAVEKRVPAAAFAGRSQALEQELARLSATGVGQAKSGRGAFVGTLVASATIALREGVEAALLIAALVAMLVRAGQGERRRWVYAGCAAALACGLVTWGVARSVLTISGLGRETVEGVSALLAAAVLFYVSYWLFARRETMRWMNFLRQQMTTRKAAYSLFGIAFLAVYREAFETVLFYEALLSDPASRVGAAALGVVVGVVLLAMLIAVYGRAGKFAPPRSFFSFSSVLLYALAFVFCGQGIAALQNADKLPLHPLSLPRVPALGLYPTVETYAVQAILLVAAATAAFILRRRAHAADVG